MMRMREIQVGHVYRSKSGVDREVKAIVPKYAWDETSTALNDKAVKFVVEGESDTRQCELNHFARFSTREVESSV